MVRTAKRRWGAWIFDRPKRRRFAAPRRCDLQKTRCAFVRDTPVRAGDTVRTYIDGTSDPIDP
jgi:hypothetical protein